MIFWLHRAYPLAPGCPPSLAFTWIICGKSCSLAKGTVDIFHVEHLGLLFYHGEDSVDGARGQFEGASAIPAKVLFWCLTWIFRETFFNLVKGYSTLFNPARGAAGGSRATSAEPILPCHR